MQNKIKILISSVGSLVGQNILDVLEYEPFRRRGLTTIIGANSISTSSNNYRCDKCYLMPNTSAPDFEEKFIEVLKDEKPDLILSGRDEDTEALSEVVFNNPSLNVKMPYGKTHTLTKALDKWETWKFSQKHDLPFATTFKFNETKKSADLQNFIDKYTFPLIAKPIRGFASKGVFFINSLEEAMKILEDQNYLLQEYIGDGQTLKEYFQMMQGPTPLFAHAPNIFHYSCHLVISPKGEFSSIFVSRNDHSTGMTIGFRKVENVELENLTKKFASAIYKEGGFGPLTVQFKMDKHNNWKAQEINFRTNGNTFPRFILGQDDLGLMINGILPELDFPLYEVTQSPEKYVIGKSLRSDQLLKTDIDTLEQNQIWEHKSRVKTAV